MHFDFYKGNTKLQNSLTPLTTKIIYYILKLKHSNTIENV